MAKYTFLLPAYKAIYLEEMLQSIKNQSYRDFKVLISDDCSPDPILEVCKPFLCDLRFEFRRNKENLGKKNLVSHWNLLLNMCETEYLIMASDDDIYAPNFLEEVDTLIQKFPSVELVRARVQKIDAEADVVEEDSETPEFMSQSLFLYNMLHVDMIQCMANYVFKRDALLDRGGFVDMPLAWGCDEATVMRMTSKGIASTADVLFKFRYSGLNISTNHSREMQKKKNEARIIFIDFFDEFVTSLPQPKNKLECRHFSRFRVEYRRLLLNSLIYGSWAYNLLEIIPYYRKITKKGAFQFKIDKFKFFWTWIKMESGGT